MQPEDFRQPPETSTHSIADSLARILTGMGPATGIMSVIGVWDDIVGEGLSAHCQPRRIDGSILLVDVDQPGWATEVRYLQTTIIDRLNAAIDGLALEQVRITVTPTR